MIWTHWPNKSYSHARKSIKNLEKYFVNYFMTDEIYWRDYCVNTKLDICGYTLYIYVAWYIGITLTK